MYSVRLPDERAESRTGSCSCGTANLCPVRNALFGEGLVVAIASRSPARASPIRALRDASNDGRICGHIAAAVVDARGGSGGQERPPGRAKRGAVQRAKWGGSLLPAPRLTGRLDRQRQCAALRVRHRWLVTRKWSRGNQIAGESRRTDVRSFEVSHRNDGGSRTRQGSPEGVSRKLSTHLGRTSRITRCDNGSQPSLGAEQNEPFGFCEKALWKASDINRWRLTSPSRHHCRCALETALLVVNRFGDQRCRVGSLTGPRRYR